MRLTVRIGGGVAGLVAVVSMDSGRLAPAEQEALQRRVERAGLRHGAGEAGAADAASGTREASAAGAAAAPAARARPDAQLYEFALEEASARYVVHYTDESLPGQVLELLAWVRSRPERQEQVEL